MVTRAGADHHAGIMMFVCQPAAGSVCSLSDIPLAGDFPRWKLIADGS
jgi:hypothetical protein